MADKQQELFLWKKWKKTGEPGYMNTLITSLDPYIQSHVNKFSTVPIPRTALESQAKLLALKALQTYDPKRGTQINTHLGHELKHLNRYVIEYQNVGKIPENRGLAISKFQNIKSNLTEDLEREPTVVELADSLQWSPAEVERMQNELRSDILITQGKEEAFFDTTYNKSDKERDIVEFVYYQSAPDEKKVLEYTFGLGGNPKLTVAEMAMRLNKTPAEIRTISKNLHKIIEDASGKY
jgi:DNA-directed RNA polymerase sigma subunit (sigma70/sigma32)